jgi:hypothetical protein
VVAPKLVKIRIAEYRGIMDLKNLEAATRGAQRHTTSQKNFQEKIFDIMFIKFYYIV